MVRKKMRSRVRFPQDDEFAFLCFTTEKKERWASPRRRVKEGEVCARCGRSGRCLGFAIYLKEYIDMLDPNMKRFERPENALSNMHVSIDY